MKRIGLLLALFIVTLILPGPLPSPTAVVQADPLVVLGGTPPVTMVDDGVTSYDMEPPVIVWNDSYSCNIEPAKVQAPQDYDEPEYIYRMPTYRGYTREIFKQEHSDPDECNPYKVLSNVVFDGQDIYWTDETGLVRLPQTANVGDAPELVSTIAQSNRNDDKVEIADGGDFIYAITYIGTNSSRLYKISKANGISQIVDTMNGATDAYDLSFDGDYFYWIFGGSLYKGDPDTLTYGFITIPVTAYYSEGLRTSCRTTCSSTHYVFIARGDEVVRYNNLDNTTTSDIYDSITDEYTITDLVTAGGFIFLLEYKDDGSFPIPQHTYHLVRVDRNGGNWDYLYDEVIGAQNILLKNIQADDVYVYWQNNFQLFKLPQDAEALPYTNLFINRVEVTQGVQSLADDVPLIRGKTTFVRVVPQADGEAVEWVTANLQLLTELGTELGEEMLPINSSLYLTVEPSPSPTVLESHFLFELPASITDTDTLRFRVIINPDNEPPELDTQQTDNIDFVALPMVASPELTIELFNLGYEVNGVAFNTNPGLAQTERWIQQAYPLSYEAFNFNTQDMNWGESLGTRVAQTHPDCAAYSSEDKNQCASDFAYNALYWLRYYTGSDEIYYGLISDGAGFVRGKGGNGVAVGPAGTDTWGWDSDGAYTDWYTAHEVGHAIGLDHPTPGSAECEHSASDSNYPYAGAQIGPGGNQIMGLRQYTGLDGFVYELYSDDDWHDMMSYCDYQWISDYSFERLRSLLNQNQQRPLQLAPVGQELLGVFGVLHTDTETAVFQILQQFDSGAAIPPLVAGDYAIRLVNGQGTTLAEYAFTPIAADDGDETALTFGQIVDWVAGTESVQIVALASGDVWVATAVSPNPPEVSNVMLLNPPNPVDGNVTLQWTATDADGDPLSFDIFYSVDGGTTMKPLVMGTTGNSATIDTSTLSGGTGIFHVSVNDGVHTETADSPSYSMADKEPVPTILAPVDGATFQWGQTIHLTGEAIDYQDGMVAEGGLRWWLNGEFLGTGAVLTTNDLLVGENEIRLSALSSRLLIADTTIHITVHDDLTIAGPDLAVGPTAVGWHVAAGETAGQSKTLALTNIGGGNLTWTASENADWLTLNASSGDTPDTVTLTADPTGLNDGGQWVTNLTIHGYDSQDNLIEIVTIPVTISSGNTWNNPPVGDPAQIYLPLVTSP